MYKLCFSFSHSLSGIETLPTESVLSKLFCFLSDKGSTLKGNYLLPLDKEGLVIYAWLALGLRRSYDKIKLISIN